MNVRIYLTSSLAALAAMTVPAAYADYTETRVIVYNNCISYTGAIRSVLW